MVLRREASPRPALTQLRGLIDDQRTFQSCGVALGLGLMLRLTLVTLSGSVLSIFSFSCFLSCSTFWFRISPFRIFRGLLLLCKSLCLSFGSLCSSELLFSFYKLFLQTDSLCTLRVQFLLRTLFESCIFGQQFLSFF